MQDASLKNTFRECECPLLKLQHLTTTKQMKRTLLFTNIAASASFIDKYFLVQVTDQMAE